MNGYQTASRTLIRKAREELAAGDLRQASEKGWGAAAQAVKAVAEAREWPHNTHGELFGVMRRLARQTRDPRVSELFIVANGLHTNFYEDWLPAEQVATGLDRVQEFVDLLAGLANSS